MFSKELGLLKKKMPKDSNKTLAGVENILFLNCGNLTKLIKLYMSKDANATLCKF